MKKKKNTTIQFKVDEDFKQQVMNYCDEHDIVMSQLIRQLLKEEMAQNSGGKEDGTSR